MKFIEYIRLFYTFFKIGLFTFGGGYAMLPLLQREVVDKHQWVDEEELLDYYSIGQSTPGIIAINTATFIGYKRGKLLGATIATLGMVLPSLIIITVIAAFLSEYRENVYVQKALTGIRGCVVALILIAVIRMAKKSVNNKGALLLFIAGFILLLVFKISAAIVVLSGILLGVIITKLKKRRNQDDTP